MGETPVDDSGSARGKRGRSPHDPLNAAEPTRRQRRQHPPEILSPDLAGRSPKRLSGSLGVICAYERSELVRRAREAALGGDNAGLEAVFAADSGAAGRLDRAAPLVRVAYRQATIVEGPVPAEGLRALLPFPGGALDLGRFVATTYGPPGAVHDLACLVIVRQPSLSDFERRALVQLSSEVEEIRPGRINASTAVERLLEVRGQVVLAGRHP